MNLLVVDIGGTHVGSIGYPGPVLRNRHVAEPHNFDSEAVFGYPVKPINDAAMQALGSYRDGKYVVLRLL
jgi:polyphosphate glucokinase